jgi:hypothetical protein
LAPQCFQHYIVATPETARKRGPCRPATPNRHTEPDEEVHIRALILSLLAVATLAASIFARFRTRPAARRGASPETETETSSRVPFSLDALRSAGL